MGRKAENNVGVTHVSPNVGDVSSRDVMCACASPLNPDVYAHTSTQGFPNCESWTRSGTDEQVKGV